MLTWLHMANKNLFVANQSFKINESVVRLIKIPIKIDPLMMSYCFPLKKRNIFTKLIGILRCNLVETRC